MRSNKDVESYLLRMGRPFKEANEGTYLVSVGSVTVVVRCAQPLVLARVEIGAAPDANKVDPKAREMLFEHLLHLNATSLVHSAYGIDGGKVVLAAALELENLDYNELDAILAELDLALVQHLPKIRELAGSGGAAKAS
ncbi:MAG: hypothetical protein NVS3B10_02380 [Polyangiales bacterium]